MGLLRNKKGVDDDVISDQFEDEGARTSGINAPVRSTVSKIFHALYMALGLCTVQHNVSWEYILCTCMYLLQLYSTPLRVGLIEQAKRAYSLVMSIEYIYVHQTFSRRMGNQWPAQH